MPDFYIKGTRLAAGYTYAVGGGGTGYTSPIFPNGASALDAFNGFMVKSAGGATVGVVFSSSPEYISGVKLDSGTVYPFRLRAIHIPAGGSDIIGLA
jgi:hypothetical protein